MEITVWSAAWFAPFVLPICFYVAWSDMRSMRIPNHSVLALIAVFVVVGLIALPIVDYGWRFSHLVVVLLIGMLLNAGGLIGAGDAKFAAAAAPFIAFGDTKLLVVIFSATLLAAWITHRLAKYSPVRRLVPDWESWEQGWDFPMGLALGGALAIYMILGILYGA
ncbi:prepilin peptidase [Shimia thalassica]|uniref:Flp pilus assembly protein, protease CpaA n=1 Tax=Shimia thalassica TaxID=1715693 RepID=A0A0P1I2D0_9RHOB|nr:prepilin peptidase [Shimia thalassica]MBU2942710.1 prepilin peptidase [Shimia thalassica]MDO6480213.1 prepilin peptidase [Shimia thalassica]MDO6502522.1 prepilin peptidase [Shimia thalassica]MDO6799708.1 prepilin peptidase [Shimia thalassica]MDP2519445.1 prepilin peptidase [Shimia thalassica]